MTFIEVSCCDPPCRIRLKPCKLSIAPFSMSRRQHGFERTHFRSHQAFGSVTETNQESLPRFQFRDPVAPQGFHMHKNILCAIAARQEAEPSDAIEPFDHNDFETACRGDLD